jgi:AcrR family transcriptional regulator
MRVYLSLESATLTDVAENVKTRPYNSDRRKARARETRLRAITAARELFIERGYPATTMDAISDRADIAPATLYRMFASKQALLKAVIDTTAVGDDEPIPLHDRPEVAELHEEPDPARYLAGFAHVARVTGERLAPMQQVLRSAAAVDPDAADMLSVIAEQRYTGQGFVARGLADRNALRSPLTEPQAHDIIYTLMSPEVRHILTQERGWTYRQYEQWLADTLCQTLL